MGSERSAKSRKRRAAEAVLELRYGSPSSDQAGSEAKMRSRMQGGGVSLGLARQPTQLHCSAGAQPEALGRRGGLVSVGACRCGVDSCPWSSRPLSVPHLDLHTIEAEGRACSSSSSSGSVGSSKRAFYPGLQAGAVVVENEAEVDAALAELRNSMDDSVVAIDLEWRPDLTGPSRNPVALIQLATSSLCVLLRTCRMGNKLPDSLKTFLADGSVTLVGFAWDSADEKKMVQTFKWGRADFGCFVDLQVVAARLGYHGCGLAALTQQVMGFEMAKDPMMSMSNWQAKTLSPQQVYYAALDALMTGHLFRGLGLWHSSPSACSACGAALGQFMPMGLRCGGEGCRRSFAQLDALLHHSRAKRHPVPVRRCRECGRWRERQTAPRSLGAQGLDSM